MFVVMRFVRKEISGVYDFVVTRGGVSSKKQKKIHSKHRGLETEESRGRGVNVRG